MASLVGFIVGFAMFGAITFLPLFFQVVQRRLADGLRPPAAAADGRPARLSRSARARSSPAPGATAVFPIVGTGLITRRAAPALAHGRSGPSTLVEALYMLVLGMGLGCVMQVLVLIVQNAVPYSELGVATSGATFFRSIGGSFGTAIFGAIFSNVLVGNLVRHLGSVEAAARSVELERHAGDPRQAAPAVHHGLVAAYAESIQTVFVIAAPIALLAFLASWLIPHVELRQAIGTSPGGATGASGSQPARVSTIRSVPCRHRANHLTPAVRARQTNRARLN